MQDQTLAKLWDVLKANPDGLHTADLSKAAGVNFASTKQALTVHSGTHFSFYPGKRGQFIWRAKGSRPTVAPPERPPATVAAEHRDALRRAAQKAELKAAGARLAELEDLLSFADARPTPAIIRTNKSRPKSGLRQATPLFMVSDLHFGETVTRAETLGENEYDLATASRRCAKMWENMLWLRADMARTQTCDDTIVLLNGDIVSGDIHDELRETNDGGIDAQCDAAVEALAPGLAEMSAQTKGKLHVVCIGGNHGRMTHKQQIKNGTAHSAEHLGIYHPLRRAFAKVENVAFHVPAAERFILTAHDLRLSAQHGTMIRSAGGIGGVLVPMTRWVTRANDADLYFFGHFHEADAYGKVVKNGSLIGPSGYTKWLGIEDRPPEQVACVIDSSAGMRRFERVSCGVK